jgi:hypothetical protein
MLTARRETRRRVEALRRIPFFADCTFDELARIDRLGTQLDVRPGRVLIREGAVGQQCFVALDGVAVAERAGQPIGVIAAGSIAGEIALLDQTRRNATVVAESPMRLLVLSDREFKELLDVAPGVEAYLTKIADERRVSRHTDPDGREAHARVRTSSTGGGTGRGGMMAATSHARRRSHTGVIAVLFVGFLVVVTAATLVFTSRGSGDSPSTPNSGVHAVSGRGVESCTWHRNGWYC